jgi:MFS family permease
MSLGPAFNRLWAASIFSNLADGLATTAFPLLAISLTRDPVLIAIAGGLVMLPWLLFAIPIGTLVDAINRKYILAGADAARALLAAALTLTIAFDVITIYLLFLFIFAAGICEVFADTASQTVLPSVVEKEKLEVANSRMEMTMTVIQNFIGAPIGALIYAVAMVAPFIANSVAFALAAMLCLTIPLKFVKAQRENDKTGFPAFREDMKFGISFLWNHHDIRRLVLASSAIGFAFSFATATMILLLVEELNLNPKHFGVLITALGVSSLLGAISAPKMAEKFGRGKAMTFGMVASTSVIFAAAFAPNLAVFIALELISSFAILHWNIILMSTYQRLIPQEIYGRVHGARRTIVWGSMPIASLLGGFAAKIDLRLPWLIGGLAAVLIAMTNARFFSKVASGAVETQNEDSAVS